MSAMRYPFTAPVDSRQSADQLALRKDRDEGDRHDGERARRRHRPPVEVAGRNEPRDVDRQRLRVVAGEHYWDQELVPRQQRHEDRRRRHARQDQRQDDEPEDRHARRPGDRGTFLEREGHLRHEGRHEPGGEGNVDRGDGCSELFHDVFGDRAAHARSAIGVSSLPKGITVEIEAVMGVAG
jgi:hypothetical protein